MNDSGFAMFGADVARDLAEWQLQEAELDFIAPLGRAGSGARLAYVYVDDKRPEHMARRLILKLCDPREDQRLEAGRLNAAWQDGPPVPRGGEPFADRHLVGQEYDPLKTGGSWLMFQRIAFDGRGFEMTRISDLEDGKDRNAVGTAVVRSILADWNPDETRDRTLTPEKFVAEILGGHRTKRNSELRRGLAELLGDRAGTWIRLPGHDAPLPHPLPDGVPSALAGRPLPYAVRGRAHGDLHPGNIMVGQGTAMVPEQYRLIDLSRYSSSALLARDPVHLLLWLVSAYLPEMREDGRTRRQLLGLLTRTMTPTEPEPPSDLIPVGLRELLSAWDGAAGPWLLRRQITEEWGYQRLLAVQACALMFLTRDSVEEPERRWFLELAARACAAYLRLTGGYRPPEVPEHGAVGGGNGEAAPAGGGTGVERLPGPSFSPTAAPGPLPDRAVPLPPSRGGAAGDGRSAPSPDTAPAASRTPAGSDGAAGTGSGGPVPVPAPAPIVVMPRTGPVPGPDAEAGDDPVAAHFRRVRPELARRLAEAADPARDGGLRESLMLVNSLCARLRRTIRESGPAGRYAAAPGLLEGVERAAAALAADLTPGAYGRVAESRAAFTAALGALLSHLGGLSGSVSAPGPGGALLSIGEVVTNKGDDVVLLDASLVNGGTGTAHVDRAAIHVLDRFLFAATRSVSTTYDILLGREQHAAAAVSLDVPPGARELLHLRLGFDATSAGRSFEAELILGVNGGRVVSEPFSFDSCFG
jgi:hypothetical protein